MKKIMMIALAASALTMGCAFTPKHGNRGPASVKADAKTPSACECSLAGAANCPAK